MCKGVSFTHGMGGHKSIENPYQTTGIICFFKCTVLMARFKFTGNTLVLTTREFSYKDTWQELQTNW